MADVIDNMKKAVTINSIPRSMVAGHVTGNLTKNTVKPQSGHSMHTSVGLSDDFTSLKEAAAVVQRIRMSVQNELEMARRLRVDAQRYQIETETKARSEAQQVILRARLSVQKQVEEMIRQASEEIQKLLADIRVIRITAQEELAAQRKFTDAARLSSMSLAISNEDPKPEVKRKKQPPAAKQKEPSA
jgi:hypothetical protein